MSRASFPVVVVLLVGALVFATVPASAAGLALVRGDDAPGMRGYAPDGTRVVVQYKPGTVTLINFWATWCIPCRDEMPALQELAERRSKDGLQVFGIHAGYVSDVDLEDFLNEIKVDYTILRPDDRWLKAWGGISVMPMTFLVGGDGKVLRRYVGATEEQIAGLVFDAEAALEGRELGPIIVPEEPAIATEEDKPKRQ